MSIMVDAIEGMKEGNGTRELFLHSRQADNERLLVSVCDTGVGLPTAQLDQIFNAFFTTKPHGTGMGLRISRSIVESHGGRLWAADNPPRGASFHFTLPAQSDAHDSTLLNALAGSRRLSSQPLQRPASPPQPRYSPA